MGILEASLDIVLALGMRDINSHSAVLKPSVLADSFWLVGKQIRTGKILHVILPDIGAGAQQCRRTEKMSPARGHVEGFHLLPLVLTRRCLVEAVRRLEPGSRQKQIQVKRICGVRLKVRTIKEGLGVSDIVNRLKLGRIQKAPRA